MIYVDDMRVRAVVGSISARWSHMFSDESVWELDKFATGLRMALAWRQDSHGFIHYDLTDPKRDLAIRLGAVPIRWRDLSNYLYQLTPPGTKRIVTTFVQEGICCHV